MLTLPLILAAISAGLIGGFHCMGMCGGIATMLVKLPKLSEPSGKSQRTIPITLVSDSESKRVPGLAGVPSHGNSDVHVMSSSEPKISTDFVYQYLLHAGRLSTYMLIGAVFGGIGALSLRWKTNLPIGTLLFLIGNLALILLALRLLGVRLQHVLPAFMSDKIQAAYSFLMPVMKTGSKYPFWMGMVWGGLPCGLSYAIAPFALLSGQAWSGAVLMLIFGLAALPHLLITQSLSQGLKRQGWMRFFQVLLALILLGIGLTGIFYADMNNMPDFLCISPKY